MKPPNVNAAKSDSASDVVAIMSQICERFEADRSQIHANAVNYGEEILVRNSKPSDYIEKCWKHCGLQACGIVELCLGNCLNFGVDQLG